MANSLLQDVQVEAARAGQRRRDARSTGSVARPLAASAIEIMQSEMLATPSDLVRVVRAEWPELWSRVIAEARRQGCSPVRQLINTIDAGLPHHG
ncbi:hypothetical protein [Sphingomonas sp. SRS2]|uniref:hypothetical protein n=1 Tax=Sphingomonas sp. SRS2 TaxID=133190 RepID=UPI0006184064|nr:hypothetical protein [Sphingomonas sp. SRS2]KKC27422.1 hypothetical protein WP12_03310 [Sphingomonas sp. SRS2]